MSLPPKMSGAGKDEKGADSHKPIPAYDPAHPHFAPSSPTRIESLDIYEADDLKPQAKPSDHKPHVAEEDSKHHHHGLKTAGWANKLAALGTKAAAPINALVEKVGSEGFLPSTMDKECEKAARILKAFCKDGVFTDQTADATIPPPAEDGKPSSKDGKSPASATKKNRTIVKIPAKVISRAVGLAIFTTARLAYGVSGATGSGILIARMPDGRWSPPSGVQVHTVGAGFVMGVDIYDCVVVINTPEALAAFTRTRMSLGSDIAVAAGPWGAGGSVDFAAPESMGKGKDKDKERPTSSSGGAGAPAMAPPAEVHHAQEAAAAGAAPAASGPGGGAFSPPPQQHERRKSTEFRPVFSYVKSRGLFAGLQVDGTVVMERKDANAAFYGVPGVTVTQILKGDVPLAVPAAGWERAARALVAVIRAAEGYQTADGMDQNAPLEAPVKLMSQVHLGGDGSGSKPSSAAAAFKAQEAGAGAEPFYPPPPPGGPPKTAAGTAAAVTTKSKFQEGGEAFYPPPPPGPPPSSSTSGRPVAGMTKAEEAAAEARANAAAAGAESGSGAAPPPRYSMIAGQAPPQQQSGPPAGGDELPSYVDDSVQRPGVGDSKTGQH